VQYSALIKANRFQDCLVYFLHVCFCAPPCTCG